MSKQTRKHGRQQLYIEEMPPEPAEDPHLTIHRQKHEVGTYMRMPPESFTLRSLVEAANLAPKEYLQEYSDYNEAEHTQTHRQPWFPQRWQGPNLPQHGESSRYNNASLPQHTPQPAMLHGGNGAYFPTQPPGVYRQGSYPQAEYAQSHNPFGYAPPGNRPWSHIPVDDFGMSRQDLRYERGEVWLVEDPYLERPPTPIPYNEMYPTPTPVSSKFHAPPKPSRGNRRARAYYEYSTKSSAINQPKKRSSATRKVTTADMKRYKIRSGYNCRNWDPDERPILLLGSVFDGNSLGKWIYDWTVHTCGESTPISEIAGDLWLLLIQLVGKIKRTEEFLEFFVQLTEIPSVEQGNDVDMLEDFVESGKRILNRLERLLRKCQKRMLKVRNGEAQLVARAAERFVNAFFGRDDYLENTEKITQRIRLWNLRWDANCEDVVAGRKEYEANR